MRIPSKAELRCLAEIHKRGPQQRTATVVRDAIDVEARTAELAFSSETDTVERWFGIEILGHRPGEVDLSRLNNGAPVLWQHNWGDQRGVVHSAWIDADGVGRALVRLSRSPEGEQLLQDIVDGIVTKVSVGYATNSLTLVEERGNTPVYRVTSWTPVEISMVSVPADDSVGVGRSASPTNLSQRAMAPSIHHKENTPTMNEISEVMAGARNAPGDIPFLDGQGNVRHVHKRAQAAREVYSLLQMETPAPPKDGLRTAYFPTGTQDSKRTKVPHALLAGSSVIAAGAHLIIAPSAAGLGTINDGIWTYPKRETHFDSIEPANFVHVIDGDDSPESPSPIHRAYADLDTMKSYSFRVKLPRAEQKAYVAGELAEYAKAAILMGLARLVDRVMIETILWHNPEAFTLPKAAAFGASFDELRALVGTGANGATIHEDGALRAAGIRAELTPETAATIVGAWRNGAVAVYEDITFHAERIDGHGGLTLTCFCNVEALLPRPEAFWTVAA